jgi:hypothetical protein
VAPFVAGKNFVANGALDFWQRGTSFTTSGSYCADRWLLTIDSPTAGVATQITSSLPTGFATSIRVQRNSGNTGTGSYGISQALETPASLPLQGRTVVFSFWAKAGANYSNAGSVLNVRINSGTGTNQSGPSQFGGWTGYTESAPDVTITTSWARYTGTFNVPSNATQVGVRLVAFPSGTAGANDWFEVTGIQLEIGPVATPFARAGGSIGGELALCKRYFERYTSAMPGQPAQIDVANRPEWVLNYTEKRVAPTITVNNPSAITWVSPTSAAGVTGGSFAGTLIGTLNVQAFLFFTVSSGISAYSFWVIDGGGAYSVDISAEL